MILQIILLSLSSPIEYAIFMEESGGKVHCPDGDAGEIGPMQITKACWIDSKVPGSYNDCRKLDYSLLVFRAYCKRYKASTDEDKARLWNGGPTRRFTDGYWERIERRLKEIEMNFISKRAKNVARQKRKTHCRFQSNK